ncbi:MAG: PIN domain-containing protein, partial [Verrucomicrobiota bacterium]
MKFWDASAVVPLLVTEPASGARERQLQDDPLLLVGWRTAVECASALQRLGREDALSQEEVAAAEARPEQLARSWV